MLRFPVPTVPSSPRGPARLLPAVLAAAAVPFLLAFQPATGDARPSVPGPDVRAPTGRGSVRPTTTWGRSAG